MLHDAGAQRSAYLDAVRALGHVQAELGERALDGVAAVVPVVTQGDRVTDGRVSTPPPERPRVRVRRPSNRNANGKAVQSRPRARTVSATADGLILRATCPDARVLGHGARWWLARAVRVASTAAAGFWCAVSTWLTISAFSEMYVPLL